MKYIWIIAGFLVLVAAGSLFVFFQDPTNIAWLVSAGVSAIASAVFPMIKKMTPEEKEERREKWLRGEGDKRH